MIQEQVAAELRATMARQRKSKAALSQATGISIHRLRGQLAGTKPMHLDEMDAICRFLGASMSKLIADIETEQSRQS